MAKQSAPQTIFAILPPMVRPTRTYNPIHFEDLEPKRFEDLVRELIYDFRDWQSIEATGRGGDDAGFDVRAYERSTETVLDEDGAETVHPMNGRLWMIQGKREKQIGPAKLRTILADVDGENPPYGYILAASVTFSKTSFDVFREELIKKGVMEFYLWGKPELEGQLHMPKNDRILFTFFGISNVSRRRSRATEIRFGVTNKNRLYRVLGDNPDYKRVLLRDSKDVEYPYQKEYADFDTRPRWRDYLVVGYHPLGLLLEIRNKFAYFNSQKNEYDIVEKHSMIFRDSDSEDDKDAQRTLGEKVRDYWERFPRRNQAKYQMHGLVRYDEMLVIDDKGDDLFNYPHIYVDFSGDTGPFTGFYDYLEVGTKQIPPNELTKVQVFPDEFPNPSFGKVHDDAPLDISQQLVERIRRYRDDARTLFDADGRFDHLSEGDVALIERRGNDSFYVQITHKCQLTYSILLKEYPHMQWDVEQQLGRTPAKSEKITALEFRPTYEHAFRSSG